ncbi:uncharacterized protein VP01_5605g2, partial [Puccinia sorghi]
FQSPNLEECIHPAFRPSNGISFPELQELDATDTRYKYNEPLNVIGKLCSFCDEPFSLHPSERLKRMDQAVKANPLVRRRWDPTNPSALQLPFALTADYCQLHHSERNIIPQGLELGWPSQIDWDLLRF